MTPSSKRVPLRAVTSRWDRAPHAGAAVTILCGVCLVTGAGRAHAGINVWTSNASLGGNVRALAVDPASPTTLYAGTYRGIFKSTDGGHTWSATGLDTTVRALVIDPTRPMTLYAGGAGLFKSTDGARTWSKPIAGLPLTEVHALAIDPNGGTLYASGSRPRPPEDCGGYDPQGACPPITGVFKSSDGGDTWSAVNTHDILALAVDPASPTTLYEAGIGIVSKSKDGGTTWSESDLAWYDWEVTTLIIDPQVPATLYAAANGKLFKSTDGARSFSRDGLSIGLGDVSVGTLAIDPTTPSTLYAGTSTSGVFKSTDSGKTWAALSKGLLGTSIGALAVDPTDTATLYAGGSICEDSCYATGVSKSTDGAGTWIATGLIAVVWGLFIDPTTPTALYVVSPDARWSFLRSDDSGSTWVGGGIAGLSNDEVQALAIDPTASNILYAGTFHKGAFKSTDSGNTWRGSGLADLGVSAIAIDPLAPTTVYAAAYHPWPALVATDIYKSTDGGTTWRATGVNTDSGGGSFRVLVIDPVTPAKVYVGNNFGGVFRSTDGGSTWSVVDFAEANVSALVIDPAAPATLYAGTHGNGVFKSTDSGETWSTLSAGLSDWRDLRINALAIDPFTPSRLYAGTDAGVFAIDQVSACAGDCTGDGQVTVNEIITMVNIALGTGSIVECGTGDANHDNQVSVDEILTAVNAALNGCPAPPMPTPRFLTEDATLYDYWPCFSPDGRSLLFSRTADGVHWELRQVPMAGGQSISFASTPLPVSATRANWSPGGDRIAFTGVSANGLAALWLISATGTDAHRVTVGGLSGLVFYPSFYPDGNRLAITDLGAGGRNGGVVRTVDLAQATVTSLTDHSEILAGMPAVSPDGQRVAFAGQRNVGQTYDETQNSIFILEPNGAVTQPDAGLGRAPAWSPDGEWIAFESSRASPDGRYAAFVMRTDGTRLRQLTDVSMDANHPVFSPDGKLLAFSASQPGWPISARGIAVIEVPNL